MAGKGCFFSYGPLFYRARNEFARLRIDADGAGAVDGVVCYYGLGEDFCGFLALAFAELSVFVLMVGFGVWRVKGGREDL